MSKPMKLAMDEDTERWVKNLQELESLGLFNALTKSLFEDALNNRVSLDSHHK